MAAFTEPEEDQSSNKVSTTSSLSFNTSFAFLALAKTRYPFERRPFARQRPIPLEHPVIKIDFIFEESSKI